MSQDSIHQTIIQKLRETEATDRVRIPLAIESGSRGWGFASPDSDYDCRFVYVHAKDWYLSVFNKPDVIEYAADKVYDVNGWDLRKFIAHIVKSNAVTFEWLSSNEIYLCNEAIIPLWRQLADWFFNPITVSHHYLSLAYKKHREIMAVESAKLKKYFYVLRPLANLRFIEQYGRMPYMEYFRTLAEIDIDKTIFDEIAGIAGIKKNTDESFVIPENRILTDYFAAEIARQEERLKTVKFNKTKDNELADNVFRKTLETAWLHDGLYNG